MKHIVIALLFVIGVAVCRELKIKKADVIHVEKAKLKNDLAITSTEEGSELNNKNDDQAISKLKHLKKRSPGRRSRERYGYNYGGRSRGGRSHGGRSRHGGHSRGGRSRGGRSRGGRSRHGGRSRGGHSRYGGSSYESYGNSRYNYGQRGNVQGGYIPYSGSRYPTYGSRYIGVIRYGGSRPYGRTITVNQRPSGGNCNCPFNQDNEPSVESGEYDFDYLRQWQRAFSSHPCCHQRWEVYWSNSQRK